MTGASLPGMSKIEQFLSGHRHSIIKARSHNYWQQQEVAALRNFPPGLVQIDEQRKSGDSSRRDLLSLGKFDPLEVSHGEVPSLCRNRSDVWAEVQRM